MRELKRRGTQLEKLVRQATTDIKHGKDLDEKLASARAEYEALLEQIDAAKQETERQELILKKKDDKVARLSQAHDRFKYELGVLKNKIEGVRAEKGEIENRLQTVYFDLRDLEEQKKGIEAAVKGVRAKVRATQDHLMKIKRTLANVLTAFANTQTKARLQFGRIKAIEE
jgi:chromosome segregation ATPase